MRMRLVGRFNKHMRSELGNYRALVRQYGGGLEPRNAFTPTHVRLCNERPINYKPTEGSVCSYH